VQLRTMLLETGTPSLGYTRAPDNTVSATLLSNSTSSNYQLYRASWTQVKSSFGFWFFDAAATIGEEQIIDAAWSNEDFPSGPCAAQ
jgi:hypothetical protein